MAFTLDGGNPVDTVRSPAAGPHAASASIKQRAGLSCIVEHDVRASSPPSPSKRCVRQALVRVGLAPARVGGFDAAVRRYKQRWGLRVDGVVRWAMADSMGLRWRTPVGVIHRTPAGHLSTDVGCIPNRSPRALSRFFAERIGPSVGQDNPHVYPLGNGRFLWLFNDAFLDYTGDATGKSESRYVHNFALLQRQHDGMTCFRSLHRGTPGQPGPFEDGDGRGNRQRWFWPLGGGIGADGQLYVFYAAMHHHGDPGFANGIPRHPDRTWIASYDPRTLERTMFRRAPDQGGTSKPHYGFAVEHADEWTYLFGNSYVQNLAVEGGYGNDPYSATRTYLARVPRGEFLEQPEYWSNGDWTGDSASATPVSERFRMSNAMQPRLIAGRWVSITKQDEFWGHDVVVDVADDPWGPWETVHEEPAPGVDPQLQVTYQPILMPWRGPGGNLIAVISLNAHVWHPDLKEGYVYRPLAYPVAWPHG